MEDSTCYEKLSFWLDYIFPSFPAQKWGPGAPGCGCGHSYAQQSFPSMVHRISAGASSVSTSLQIRVPLKLQWDPNVPW